MKNLLFLAAMLFASNAMGFDYQIKEAGISLTSPVKCEQTMEKQPIGAGNYMYSLSFDCLRNSSTNSGVSAVWPVTGGGGEMSIQTLKAFSEFYNAPYSPMKI